MRFRNELRLLRGDVVATSDKPSFIQFAFYSSGSKYVSDILSIVADQNGLTPISIPGLIFNYSQEPFAFRDGTSNVHPVLLNPIYKHTFRPKGFAYLKIIGVVEGIEQLDRYRKFLMIRDPRGMVLSSYNKIRLHALPDTRRNIRRDFLKRRAIDEKLSFDEYAHSLWHETRDLFIHYEQKLIARYPDVFVTKFEDMTRDFPQWLSTLFNKLDLEVDAKTQQSFLQNDKKLQSVFALKNSKQLKPVNESTMEFLTDRFSDIIGRYEYPRVFAG